MFQKKKKFIFAPEKYEKIFEKKKNLKNWNKTVKIGGKQIFQDHKKYNPLALKNLSATVRTEVMNILKKQPGFNGADLASGAPPTNNSGGGTKT